MRICLDGKEFSTNIFNKGVKDLHQKDVSADLVEQIRKTSETFPDSERFEVPTVRGYFSRLASQHKGLPVSKE